MAQPMSRHLGDSPRALPGRDLLSERGGSRWVPAPMGHRRCRDDGVARTLAPRSRCHRPHRLDFCARATGQGLHRSDGPSRAFRTSTFALSQRPATGRDPRSGTASRRSGRASIRSVFSRHLSAAGRSTSTSGRRTGRRRGTPSSSATSSGRTTTTVTHGVVSSCASPRSARTCTSMAR